MSSSYTCCGRVLVLQKERTSPRLPQTLKKIDNMVNAGASLDDAVSYMGVVTILPPYCRRTAAVLPPYCRRTAAVLPAEF